MNSLVKDFFDSGDQDRTCWRRERLGRRDEDLTERLEKLGLVTSHWLESLSTRHGIYGQDAPCLDLDAVLVHRYHSYPVGFFEFKFQNAALSKSETKVLTAIANEGDVPAWVVRYWRQNSGWMWQIEAMNDACSRWIYPKNPFTDEQFEDWMSRFGGRSMDRTELTSAMKLSFMMVEFDFYVPKALVDYRAMSSGIDLESSDFRLINAIGSENEIPSWSALYNSEQRMYLLYPHNGRAQELFQVGAMMTEAEYVELLYRVRQREVPGHVLENLNKLEISLN